MTKEEISELIRIELGFTNVRHIGNEDYKRICNKIAGIIESKMVPKNMMVAKKAKTSEEAWEMGEKYKDSPHGWIQWKGTKVCMDVYCKCGHQDHIDASFAYHVKCPDCGTIYMCNGHIEFIELEEDPGCSVVTPESDSLWERSESGTWREVLGSDTPPK